MLSTQHYAAPKVSLTFMTVCTQHVSRSAKALVGRVLVIVMLLLDVTIFSGCAHAPVTRKQLPSPVISREQEILDRKLVEKALLDLEAATIGDPKDGDAYRVGPGDTLLVAVYNHPELALSTYAGAGLGAGGGLGGRNVGFLIDNDGTIQFPLIGTVPVAGKKTSELRAYLEQELALFVKEPKVTVQVLMPGSIRYYLLGQFADPGMKHSDRPLRLLEALALGGTVLLERSSLRGAYLARGKKRLPINFIKLIREGDLSQNIKLQSGDLVFVPDNMSEHAFVFAAIAGGTARGGAVPFLNGRLNIVQALAAAGYGFRERAMGRLSKVRVIRSQGDHGEFLVVDVSAIVKGEAAPFPLMAGDVVYVPSTAVANWNMALEQLLPTLQTVSGLLNPFVQIKYLSN